VKTDPMPQISADRPAQAFEAITIAHPPGRKRWNGGGRAAVWLAGCWQGTARPDHQCPKPVELMERARIRLKWTSSAPPCTATVRRGPNPFL